MAPGKKCFEKVDFEKKTMQPVYNTYPVNFLSILQNYVVDMQSHSQILFVFI